MIQSIIDILSETSSLEYKLDASIELIRAHLLDRVELGPCRTFCLFHECCSLEETLKGREHVALVLANLRLLSLRA